MKARFFLATFFLLSFFGASAFAEPDARNLMVAREGFVTKTSVSNYKNDGPAAKPPAAFELVRYRSRVGALSAYVSKSPGDSKKYPAVLWAHGGFGGIGLETLKQIEPLANAGIIVMTPSWRGENDNPGRYEMFYGEVDDALAALEHLTRLPYVDPTRIYVAGHSTGGTIALLVAESTDRVRAVFSIGGAPDIERVLSNGGYDLATPPFLVSNPKEAELRSPLRFVAGIKQPTWYFEGAHSRDYVADARKMEARAEQLKVPFHSHIVKGADHFTVVRPLLGLLAQKIVADAPTVTQSEVQALFALHTESDHVVITHPHAKFQMRLGVSANEVCQILPAGAEDPVGCEDVDVEGNRSALTGQATRPFAANLVRLEETSPLVLATVISGASDFSTSEAQQAFVRGVRDTTPPGTRLSGTLPGTTHDAVTIAGRTAVRVKMELAVPTGGKPGDAPLVITYAIPAEGETILVQFFSTTAYATELEALAGSTIATTLLPLPKPQQSGAYEQGYWFGRLLGGLMPIGLLAMIPFYVLLTLVRRAQSQKKQ